MKRNIILKILAFSLAITLLSMQGVFAAGAEIPNKFKLEEITPSATRKDVIRSYDTYQGEVVIVEEVVKLLNGARAYYIGPVEYLGRDGWFGRYMYLGNLDKFKFIKMVNPDGTVVTPTSQGNKY